MRNDLNQDVQDVTQETIHVRNVVVECHRRCTKWTRHLLRKDRSHTVKHQALSTRLDDHLFWTITVFTIGILSIFKRAREKSWFSDFLITSRLDFVCESFLNFPPLLGFCPFALHPSRLNRKQFLQF